MVRIWRTRVRELDCREASSMVQDYLDDALPDEELEDFLNHIGHCHSCYDELETYYMLERTLKYLDEDEDISADLSSRLVRDISEKRHRLRENRKIRRIRWLILITTGILISLVILDVTGLFKVTEFFLY